MRLRTVTRWDLYRADRELELENLWILMISGMRSLAMIYYRNNQFNYFNINKRIILCLELIKNSI